MIRPYTTNDLEMVLRKRRWPCFESGGLDGGAAIGPSKLSLIPFLPALAPSVYIHSDGTLAFDGNNQITQANDDSGNGVNLFGLNPGANPTLVPNIFGPLPGIRFMPLSSPLLTNAFTKAQPLTVLVSCQLVVANAQSAIFGGGNPNNARVRVFANTQYRMYSGIQITGGVPDTNRHVIVAIFNGASSKLYIDGGAAVASGNAGTNGFNAGLQLASDPTGQLTNAFNGYYLDFIVVPSVLSLSVLNAGIGPAMAVRANTTWTQAT